MCISHHLEPLLIVVDCQPLLKVVDCRMVIHRLLDDDQFDMDGFQLMLQLTPTLHSVNAHGNIFNESKLIIICDQFYKNQLKWHNT